MPPLPPLGLLDLDRALPQLREELQALCDWGMQDAFRHFHDEDQVFSWWDYRAGDFHMGRGLRIDLILGTAGLFERCTACTIDRNERKGQSPSDHAPVVAEIAG